MLRGKRMINNQIEVTSKQFEVVKSIEGFVVSVNNDTAKSLALIAKRKKISSTTLLQRWVSEKVSENSTATR